MLKRILLADDDAHMRRFMRYCLGPQYEYLEAGDGEATIELARRERPDVIFLDVNMPGLKGFEVCEQIKRDATLRGTRVVILTSFRAEEDRARGQAVGADAYITKPCGPLALRAKLAEILQS